MTIYSSSYTPPWSTYQHVEVIVRPPNRPLRAASRPRSFQIARFNRGPVVGGSGGRDRGRGHMEAWAWLLVSHINGETSHK